MLLYTADLSQLDVMANTSAGSGANISWPPPQINVCPCVNYTIRINGVDEPDNVACDQTSYQIGSEKLWNCAVNNVTVIPRSAHPNIGLLKNLGGHIEFMYGPISKSIPFIH